ncbi:MAG: hypothetical protein K8F91_12635, partial [Candidatus Obscuribacterales bacterium]|nr:hypothetical protein [Candidatus Obscuribacterales bacterium]
MSKPRFFVLTSRFKRVFSLGLCFCLSLGLLSCRSSVSNKEGQLPHLTHIADRDTVQSDASLSKNGPTAA